jgi:hypothetical protein
VKHTPEHVEILVIDHTIHLLHAPTLLLAENNAGTVKDVSSGCQVSEVSPATTPPRLGIHASVHLPRIFVSVVHSRRAREVALGQMQALRAAVELDDEGHFQMCLQVGEVRAASGDLHSKFVDALSVPVKRARTEEVSLPGPHSQTLLPVGAGIERGYPDHVQHGMSDKRT